MWVSRCMTKEIVVVYSPRLRANVKAETKNESSLIDRNSSGRSIRCCCCYSYSDIGRINLDSTRFDYRAIDIVDKVNILSRLALQQIGESERERQRHFPLTVFSLHDETNLLLLASDHWQCLFILFTCFIEKRHSIWSLGLESVNLSD